MKELFGLNPVAEAMVYFYGMANNERVEKKVSETVRNFPENETAVKTAAKPAAALEKLLDRKLNINNELISKFFRRLSNYKPNTPFGFCLASVMIFCPLTEHLEYSPDEMYNYLLEFNTEKQFYSLCFGLSDKCETVHPDECSAENFSERIKSLQLSADDKWKLANAALAYRKHIIELFSLIMPAVRLIQSAADEYAEALKSFREFYSDIDVQSFFKSYFGNALENVDLIKIAPIIMGFNEICALTGNGIRTFEDKPENDTDYPCEIFVGVSKHITNKSQRYNVSALCDKFKALSDNTRLEILLYLCSGRAYNQELCTKFGLQHSAISYHMVKLESVGFVTSEFLNGKTYYEADKAGIQRMLDSFAEKIK